VILQRFLEPLVFSPTTEIKLNPAKVRNPNCQLLFRRTMLKIAAPLFAKNPNVICSRLQSLVKTPRGRNPKARYIAGMMPVATEITRNVF
jgi:hypothetical protein